MDRNWVSFPYKHLSARARLVKAIQEGCAYRYDLKTGSWKPCVVQGQQPMWGIFINFYLGWQWKNLVNTQASTLLPSRTQQTP